MCLCVLSPSDSDGSVDSDIEDAIMAQLYFRDAVKKKSGMHYYVIALFSMGRTVESYMYIHIRT